MFDADKPGRVDNDPTLVAMTNELRLLRRAIHSPKISSEMPGVPFHWE